MSLRAFIRRLGSAASSPRRSRPVATRVLVVVCLLASACAKPVVLRPSQGFQQPLGAAHPLAGRIYSRQEAKLVSVAALMDAVEQAQVLLLGETHDNRDHHQLQATVLAWFLEDGDRAYVAFEMLDRTYCDAEAVLSRTKDPDQLAAQVRWRESGWPPFDLYRPIFAAAIERGATIVCALPNRQQVMAAMHGVPPPERDVLKLDPPLPIPQQRAQAEQIRIGHCGHAPEPMVSAMQRAQSFKDAAMARALIRPGARVALIAGRGHVRDDRGVPYFLRRHGVANVVSVAFLDVDDARDEPQQYEVAPYDFTVFTPRVTDEDPCERFRRQLDQLREPHATPDTVRRTPPP